MSLQVQNEASFENMLQDIQQTQQQCKALLQSKHYQSLGEQGIFAILQKAKSLGINPISALNGGLYYVQGKVGMSTEMMATLIRRAGHSISKDPKSDNTICILHGKRADNGDTWTCSFSIDDAKRAGLYKNMYEKYPQIMIYNRTCSMLARQLFPDIIDGCGYSLEELQEIKESKGTPEKPVVYEAAPVEKISQKQFEDINDMIGEDEEYRGKVMKFLNDHLHISSLLDLPEHMYNRVMNGAKTNHQEKAKKMEAECKQLTTQEGEKENS